mmetsp:Transcript_11439/g.24394  ORF Transcript_11439/g.24394 Transcript_11439/m.24394 type:complete len:257 (-) Transcript_11439:1124-1894(-)
MIIDHIANVIVYLGEIPNGFMVHQHDIEFDGMLGIDSVVGFGNNGSPHPPHMFRHRQARRLHQRKLQFGHIHANQLIGQSESQRREQSAPNARVATTAGTWHALRSGNQILFHLLNALVPNLRGEAGNHGQFHLQLGIQFIPADNFRGQINGIVIPPAHDHDGLSIGMLQRNILPLSEVFGMGHPQSLNGKGRGGLIEDEVHDGIASFVVSGDDDLADPFAFEGGLGTSVVGGGFGSSLALGEDVEEGFGAHYLGA